MDPVKCSFSTRTQLITTRSAAFRGAPACPIPRANRMKHRAVLAVVLLAVLIGAAVVLRSRDGGGVGLAERPPAVNEPVSAQVSASVASNPAPAAKQTQTQAQRGTE